MTRLLFPLLSLAILVAACGQKEEPLPEPGSAARPLVVGPESFAVAIADRIVTGPSISGTLQPRREATVRAQLSGAVLGAYAEQGQRVGSGSVLARIDDRAIRDAVASAQAAVRTAQSSLEVARREESRLQALFEAGAIAERDVENARRSRIAAESSVTQARSQLVAAQKQQANTTVTAPFSGVVSEKLAGTGDIVQPGSAIYTIVDPSTLQLEATVPAEDASKIHVGDPVDFSVNGYPNQRFTGVITRINPVADPATRQVRVYAEIPNGTGTLIGDLFADGRVIVTSRQTVTLPESAIDRRAIRPTVHRLDGGVVREVPVSVGISDERSNRVEILNGIRQGDTVLVGPSLTIAAGTHIRTAATKGGAATKAASGAEGGTTP